MKNDLKRIASALERIAHVLEIETMSAGGRRGSVKKDPETIEKTISIKIMEMLDKSGVVPVRDVLNSLSKTQREQVEISGGIQNIIEGMADYGQFYIGPRPSGKGRPGIVIFKV